MQIKFEELVDAFQFHQCRYPHDRVYALINVSDLSRNFAIDYGASTKDFLFHIVAARSHRLTTNTLSLLQQVLNVYLSKDDLVYLQKIRNGGDHWKRLSRTGHVAKKLPMNYINRNKHRPNYLNSKLMLLLTMDSQRHNLLKISHYMAAPDNPPLSKTLLSSW